MPKRRSDEDLRRLMLQVPMCTLGQIADALGTNTAELHMTRSSGREHQINATNGGSNRTQIWSGCDAIRLAIAHAAAAVDLGPADRLQVFEEVTVDQVITALDAPPEEPLVAFILADEKIRIDFLSVFAEGEMQAVHSGRFINLTAVAEKAWSVLRLRLPESGQAEARQ